MDIVSWINKVNNQHGTESVSNRFNTTQWLRPGYRGGQLVDHGPAGVRQGYGKTPTSRKYIEKGIYRRDNGNYRLVANREGAKKLDKTLPKGSTLEDARKALSAWEKANPIKVKWKEGQKIKLITEGPKGKQVNVDIKYKTPKIEADFKAAMADFAGENKAGWSKAKFDEKFGNISQDAMQFAREQDPALVRDVNKVQTLKYADELEELGHKDWNAAIKAGDDKLVMSHRWQKLNPYERKGFETSRNQLAKNIENLNIFEKSGQTLDDFYDLFKDITFKKNLREYIKGEAGPFVTEAWDEAGFKSKYKNIIPKMKKHLEVWHEQSDPSGKTKAQIKKAKVREFSKLDIENLIKKAKRVGKTDYLNQLDLAHRQDLIIDQNISELGIERPEINRVLIKDAEIERNKLHKKNYALIEEVKKGKNVQKNLSLIAENNHRIQQIANITKGRLTGIIIDTETLTPVKLKPSNIMGVDVGILNKPIKEMTEADKIYLKNKILPTVIDEARAMTPQKIASELSGIMDDPVLSKKLETRISKLETGRQITKPVFEQSKEIYRLMQGFCGYGKSAGGRIGFKAGSCPTDVAARNFLMATNDVAKGRVTGEAAEQIAKKAARITATAGSKTALASILGPAGIVLDIAYEVGSIGTDVLGGKSFKRALQDNWITGAFISGTGQEEFHKELFAKDSRAKPYGTALDLIDKIEKAEKNLESVKQATYRTPGQKEEAIAMVGKRIKNLYSEFDKAARRKDEGPAGQHTRYLALEPGSAEQRAYEQAKQEFESIEAAKAPLKWKSKHGFEQMVKEGAQKRPVNTYGYVKPKQYGEFSKDQLDEFLKWAGAYGPHVNPENFGFSSYEDFSDRLSRQKSTWDIAQAGGVSKMARGGLANLTRTVAPDSGPMSQGLRSLYIDDMD